MNPELAVAAVANLSISDLSDDELVALNLVIQLGNPDIKNVMGYEKVKTLFTENNGTRCHSLVEDAFSRAVLQRLG
ncbi:hypothetical protein kac65v162_gp137 [Nodularia phage vB_NspS-kac65v162]|jgi:hypothetical protein|uniref:Uncharacterized protein n=6 Tax=Ravarandavirus TaxID=2843444 RepID=A0A482MIF5_9CAUD|nr:hypothetical protein HWC12_gp180 [Nodularia phage vB_NspS-kac65v151]QBQ73167.1 hypothetical protein kac65v151_gp137 [Nodularia phage vB_NspS-kac65v151]QBQ73375.1 hypothetical protein kac65v161_gp137 [Nodularia phage vB_NspS-kac65v161]QBQ73581.1 hypothetical protein kac65v162_gp137 [Nodularia phage vB_NspS-kac65v162]